MNPRGITDDTIGRTLNDVSPLSVKSIPVLKDASAAIYGSPGYGGAIIIKTKTYDKY